MILGSCFSSKKIIPEVSEFLLLIYELYVKDRDLYLLFFIKVTYVERLQEIRNLF